MWTITKLNIFYRFGDACDNCPDDRNPDQGMSMKLNYLKKIHNIM